MMTTCTSDAAYDRKSKKAGLAWIFTDSRGNHLNHGSSTCDRIATPLIAEAIALQSGLLSAVNLGFSKIRLVSDNLTLVRAINNDAQNKEIFGIVESIKSISSAFVEITFTHISRSSIVEVDRLAKSTLSASLVMDPLLG